MPRPLPPDVAAHFQALIPSCIARVARRLHARGRELLGELPALDAASVSLGDFAATEGLDRLTVVRAVLESSFDNLGRLRFIVVSRPDGVWLLALRFPVELILAEGRVPE
eukprot:4591345-Alexandrium_andersonii.AAC.1